MSEESEKTPKPGKEPVDRPKKPLLDTEEEFTLLLKTIDENSKHARTVMFTLVLACLYVLLAAFSSSVGVAGQIKLPVLNANVSEREFFFSPLVILVAYLYLHIYIRELRNRLKSADECLDSETFIISEPYHLLFPWIAVFAFRQRQERRIPEPWYGLTGWIEKV